MDMQSLPSRACKIKYLAFAAALLPLPASANVVFDFIPTAISCDFGTCFLPSKPIAELILPGPDSSGSAGGLKNPDGSFPSTWNGDPFILAVGTWIVRFDDLQGPRGGSMGTERYSVSWSESNNVLDSVFIQVHTLSLIDATLGLGGGTIASDGESFGGCINTTCRVSGFWQDPPGNIPQLVATPEPGSSLGLLAAALGIMGLRRRA